MKADREKATSVSSVSCSVTSLRFTYFIFFLASFGGEREKEPWVVFERVGVRVGECERVREREGERVRKEG